MRFKLVDSVDELSTWWRACLVINVEITVLFIALALRIGQSSNVAIAASLFVFALFMVAIATMVLVKWLRSTKVTVFSLLVIGLAQLAVISTMSLFTLLSLAYLFDVREGSGRV